jgi:DNA-directed RNA polymerase specialized sigma24 family protein
LNLCKSDRELRRRSPSVYVSDIDVYARALTRNRERADDLVQDTLSRALVKEQFWQPGTNLRAWLFTIMHNQNVKG